MRGVRRSKHICRGAGSRATFPLERGAPPGGAANPSGARGLSTEGRARGILCAGGSMGPTQPLDIEVTTPAREALRAYLERSGPAQYVRIHVGRG